MNLFSESEGRRQEVLACSVLRYLLAGSHELRTAFLSLLEEMFGPMGSRSHFATYLEFPTTFENENDGRLDLLIETDSALVGIEAKISSGLASDQPQKYVSSLIRRAKALKALRRLSDYPVFVVVLASDSREKYIQDGLLDRSRQGLFADLGSECRLLSWKQVFDKFGGARNVSPQMAYVAEELRAYVSATEGALADFRLMVPHLHRWEPGGSRWQRDVVGELWHLIPGTSPRRGSTETWCGYSIKADDGQLVGWYGFVPKNQFADQSGLKDTELIIQSKQPIPGLESSDFTEPRQLISNDYPHTWIINYGPLWTTKDWVELLDPLQDLFLEQGT